MNFLCQIDLQQLELPLPAYSAAFVFACHGYENRDGSLKCQTYLPDSGATAVVLATSIRSGARTKINPPKVFPERAIKYRPFKTIEERQAGRDPNLLVKLMDEARKKAPWWKRNITLDLTEHFKDPVDVVMAGGAPIWVQDDETPYCRECGRKMSLLFQLEAEVKMGSFDESKYYFPFGDAGCGYVFHCDQDCQGGKGVFFWQTT